MVENILLGTVGRVGIAWGHDRQKVTEAGLVRNAVSDVSLRWAKP